MFQSSRTNALALKFCTDVFHVSPRLKLFPVRGIVLKRASAHLGFVQPDFAALERGTVEMQRVCDLCGMRISNFVIALTVVNVDNVVLFSRNVLCAHQFVAVTLTATVSTLLDLAMYNFHPASIARMIVNGGMMTRIPAQEQQSVACIVGSNQVARVMH